MSLNKNIKNYAHVGRVLDAAIKAGGGRYTLPDEKKAIRFRLECYYYRKLFEFERRNQLGYAEGVAVRTPYDDIMLTLDGSTVVIQDRKSFPFGELRGPDGRRLELEPLRTEFFEDLPDPGTDSLEDAARKLAQQLGGEDETESTQLSGDFETGLTGGKE